MIEGGDVAAGGAEDLGFADRLNEVGREEVDADVGAADRRGEAAVGEGGDRADTHADGNAARARSHDVAALRRAKVRIVEVADMGTAGVSCVPVVWIAGRWLRRRWCDDVLDCDAECGHGAAGQRTDPNVRAATCHPTTAIRDLTGGLGLHRNPADLLHVGVEDIDGDRKTAGLSSALHVHGEATWPIRWQGERVPIDNVARAGVDRAIGEELLLGFAPDQLGRTGAIVVGLGHAGWRGVTAGDDDQPDQRASPARSLRPHAGSMPRSASAGSARLAAGEASVGGRRWAR